ncbi:MAG: SDR family oxidoreductase [Thermodesulfobacteriota bacterium]
MEIREPEIRREDVLVLLDDDFNGGNVCVVTGCASGIGRATAVAASANGLLTVGLDLDEKGGEETCRIARLMGGKMVFLPTDLSRDEQIQEAIEEAAKLGHIKYLANIAGLQHIDTIENFPMESYDLMQRVMLRAPFLLSKLVIPHMRRGPGGTGVVGNMASIHAHICTSHKSVYNIVKFGLRGLTQSIAAEGDGKIRAFSVSTGFVSTPLALKQVPAQAAQRGLTPEEVVREVMMGRSRIKEMMAPIEVANLFIFGFSRYSRYLIGGDLLFDGGVVSTY